MKIGNLFKFGFAAVLIYWLVHSGRLDVEQLLRLFTPGFFITGMILIFLNIFLNNIRWYWLLKAQNFTVRFAEVLKLTFIGLFFNLAVPGGVGGDLVKGYYLVRDNNQRKMAAAMTILMDRILGLVGMVLLCFISVAMNFHFISDRPDLKPIWISLLVLCSVFFIFFCTALSRRFHKKFQKIWQHLPWGQKFQKLHDVVHDYRKDLPILIRCVLLSSFSQSLTIFFFIMTGSALGMHDVPWQAYFFVVPLGLIILAVPVAPGGIGVGQVAFFILFNRYLGYESQLGTASISGVQIMNILWGVVGAFFYFQRRNVNVGNGTIAHLKNNPVL